VSDCLRLFSIDHSNHSADELSGLLEKHDIDVRVDVRSHPYSRSRYARTAGLNASGQTYLFHAVREDGIAWKPA
jgi:hypothetical protein